MIRRTIALVFLILSLSAEAVLINNGIYTTDTDTQTDYLHLSETVGYSFQDIVTNDVLGFINAGWELTAQDALYSLIIDTQDTYTFINGGAARYIITDNALRIGQSNLPDAVFFDYWPVESEFFSPGIEPLPVDYSYDDFAVSLMRATPVPIPASGWLFISALVGLVGKMRLSRR